MTFFLLSLGGFPPTAGFIAKWYVFSAAVGAGYYGLAIIGVLSSVISVFFFGAATISRAVKSTLATWPGVNSTSRTTFTSLPFSIQRASIEYEYL